MAVLAKLEETSTDRRQEKISEAICYLAERLAALSWVADPARPKVNMSGFVDIPYGDGKRRGPSRTMMFDIARGLARRVPLTKLI